ncbi:MAG: substrate-binding domain-containing protein [Candidatus Pristimantibacillus sp.]
MNKSQKQTMIRAVWLSVIVILAALGLMSCSSTHLGNQVEAQMHITLVAPVHAGEQGDAMRLGADAAAKEFGAELEYISFEPAEDAKEQLEAAMEAVKQGASAVLIDPADEDVLKELAAKASARGAPVITLNNVQIDKGVMAAISIDNELAGRQAGVAMAELLSGSGTITILRSDRSDPDLELREAGIRAALAEYEDIRVTEGASCGTLRSACWQAAMQLLEREQVEGVVALETPASLGLSDEVKRRGEERKIKIVAFGSETAQLELLQEGILHKLVVQNGFSTGYLGVQQAVELLSGGGRVDKPTLLETKVIDADNMFWMVNQKMLFPFVQ